MRRLITIGLVLAACDTSPQKPPYEIAACDRTLWYRAQSPLSHVEVVTSWENWQTGLHVMDDAGDGWRATHITPPPGEVEYAFLDDGVWVADPFVGTTAFHDGAEVTLLFEDDCSMPSLRVDGADSSSARLTFITASDGTQIDPTTIEVTPSSSFGATVTPGANDTFSISFTGLPPGKNIAMVTAKDLRGRATSNARVTIWNEPTAWDWRDAVIYQVLVDRYRNAQGAVAQPAVPSDFAGGTIAGLTADLDTIASRGFNALWVMPLYQNPPGTFLGTDGRPYSAYHGYWPMGSRSIDSRFGSEADVDALIAGAHARGMRVIFDVVPHHVHQEHPYVAQHGASWFTDWQENCVCGIGSCDWGNHIQDCWFASYLPSFDWHQLDVADTTTDDVAWWIDRFDADGLRIDAVPMMPRAAIRRITDVVRRKFDHPNQRTYLLGENFVGAGAYDLLRYELGPFGLDGEFDFPMMWVLRGAIAQETEPMSDLDDAEKAGEASWAGSGAVMSRMIGNHDVVRFSSLSAGDADGDGWTPAPQSTDPLVYRKQQMALAMTYTLPGATVVYYGDEIALAGRQDPDSRRALPADAALSPDQIATRNFTAKLGKLRACSDPLRRGTYRSLVADTEVVAFAREDAGDAALVVVARNPAAPITLPAQGLAKGSWTDALGSGVTFDASQPTFTLPSHSVAVFVPAASTCKP
ncbi:MAG TPA: alpha-amylase family glycosyl hydrolase [Polyangiaceae bacterium]